ncbi:MAG: phospholipase D-like domain-containing protein [Candidimonas sp.]|jgi:cardiolipin synthase
MASKAKIGLRVRQLIGIAAALGALLLLAQCVVMPDAGELPAGRGQAEASTAHGWRTYEESRAAIQGIKDGQAHEDYLAEHLAVERAIADGPLRKGNAIDMYTDGESAYDAMEAAIRGARHFIHLESYIFEDDEIGRRFTDLLIAKRREGVAVAVIVDGVGSLAVSEDMLQGMKAEGLQVLIFNSLNPFSDTGQWNPNRRNHRKVLIIDGKIGFIGGINISDVYSSGSAGGSGASGRGKAPRQAATSASAEDPPWRDTHIRIEGPAVADLVKVFLWAWETQKGPLLEKRPFFPRIDEAGPHTVRILANQPGEDQGHSIYLALMSAIGSARESIYVTMAYFVPDPAFIKALRQAARRGVEVVLILPGFSDSAMVFHAGRSHYQDLMRAGVRIHERHDVLLHAKTAVIDGVWSTVGSSNLDWRSFLLNYEINAVVLGRQFGARMQADFKEDLALSDRVDEQVWANRGFYLRFMEFLSRIWERWL